METPTASTASHGKNIRSVTPGAREELAVWGGLAAGALAVLVTYARVDPAELYHVGEGGLAGGLSRALVFLNFPVALVALALAAIAAAVLRRAWAVAGAALVIASAALVPFVVDQDDLDARPANAIPALGVAVALALTLVSLRRRRARHAAARLPGDRARLAVGVLVVAIGIPWLFAELGAYAPDPFLGEEIPPGEQLAAVHLGHHHGTDGVVLALVALALSRVPPRLGTRWIAAFVSAYLALMLAYGFANALQDAWLEQVVKRGTTSVEIPEVTYPAPTLAWAVIVLAAAAVELAWFRRERLRLSEPAPPRGGTPP